MQCNATKKSKNRYTLTAVGIYSYRYDATQRKSKNRFIASHPL